MTLVQSCLLVMFFFALILSLFTILFHSLAGLLRWYLLPLLRVVFVRTTQLPVPLQHECLFPGSLLGFLASHSSELLSTLWSFCVVLFFFLVFMVWLVSLCSRTRYASISLDLHQLIAVLIAVFSVSQSVTT